MAISKKLALTLYSLTLFSCAQAQNLQYFTNVRSHVDDQSQEIWVENDPTLQTVAVNTDFGLSTASAQTSPGIQRVFSHFDSPNSSLPAMSMIADAWTHWTDTVVISDPNLNGTIGHFTASLLVHGNATFALSGGYASGDIFDYASIYGFWDSWIGTSTDGGGSFLVGGWFGDWTSDEFGNVWYSGDDLNQPLTEVELEFIYGEPFLLRTNMEAYMDATNMTLLPGTVDATLDFSHTTYWNGISGFTDSNGNSVTPEFQSVSGIDWRLSAVPEPATLSLFGVAVLTLLRKRKRT
ncbi:MAG: PEP-CTERM sorting domain-containing protein [Armatimonadetes bacterium]|nr:PEP-CTERM sorting domain-containing protein [Armatimonadota bacterium]